MDYGGPCHRAAQEATHCADPSVGKARAPKGTLACLYTNARSLGNKQDELVLLLSAKKYDVIGKTETWWDSTHDWTMGIEGYTLYRRDRVDKRGGGVALYVKESYMSLQADVGDRHGQLETLWVKIRGEYGTGDTTVGVYYRPPTQSPELDQEFARELTEAACSRTLVVMGDFNYPDISWEDHSAKSERSQSFLSCVDDLYLTQEVYGPTRGKALLDPVLATGDNLIGGLVIDGKLGDSDHELITFTIHRKAGKSVSNMEVLDFRKAHFDKLRRLVSAALRDHDPGGGESRKSGSQPW